MFSLEVSTITCIKAWDLGSGWEVGWDDILGQPPNTMLAGDPSCVSWAPGTGLNRIDCVSLGHDMNVWHDAYDPTLWGGNHWSGWERRVGAGGSCLNGVSVSSGGANHLDLFATTKYDNVGCFGELNRQFWDGTSWSNWANLGSSDGNHFSGEPRCISWAANRIDCVARTPPDNSGYITFYDKAWTGNSWSDFILDYAFGGWGDPEVVAPFGAGRLDVIAVGGLQLFHFWFTNFSQQIIQPSGHENVPLTTIYANTYVLGSTSSITQYNVLIEAAWIRKDASYTFSITFVPGDEMRLSTIVAQNTNPVTIQASIDGKMGSLHAWSVQSTGYNYIINFGPAPNMPGKHTVYTIVTFADGSTATSNAVSATI